MQSLLLRRGAPRPSSPSSSSRRPPSGRRRTAPVVAPARAVSIPPTVPYPPDQPGDDEQAAEETVRSGWDPEGLFAGASGNGGGGAGGDLFARQQARRAAAAAAAEQQLQEQERAARRRPAPTFDEPPAPLPADWLGGESGSGDDPTKNNNNYNNNNPAAPLVGALTRAQRRELAAAVAGVFPSIDLGYPGLRVLHLRPPVLAIDGFASPADCEAWMREADASGRLATSRVGAGHAGGGNGGGGNGDPSPSSAATSVSYDAAQRTSTNLLVDPATRRAAPVLGLLADAFQERALELLDAPNATTAAAVVAAGAGGPEEEEEGDDDNANTNNNNNPTPPNPAHRPGSAWGAPGRMPLPRQYTFEAPQVTRYLPPEAAAGRARGQLFGEHEDAFPRVVARANGFQRHATLLLYLNGRARHEGGATCFPYLQSAGGGEEGGGGASAAAAVLASTPWAGRLLVFFPSADDGTPDARTLHAAEEVVSGGPKWVMQQWVARGYASPSALRQMQQGAQSQEQQQQQQQQQPQQQPLTRKERRERARQEAAAAKQQGGGGGPRRKKA